MNAPHFLAEAPLRQARRYADADLADKATPSQLTWLHAHSVLWLRALIEVELDVNSHIEKSRTDLSDQKPPGGRAPSLEYLEAKAAHEKRNLGRVHFKRLVEKRKAEVRTVIGSDPIRITGDVVEAMLRLAAFIDDDDVQSARDMALHYADKWAARGASDA